MSVEDFSGMPDPSYKLIEGTESRKILDDNLENIMKFSEELIDIYGLLKESSEDKVVAAIYNNGDTYTMIMGKLAIHYGLPTLSPYEVILQAKKLKDEEKKRKELKDKEGEEK